MTKLLCFSFEMHMAIMGWVFELYWNHYLVTQERCCLIMRGNLPPHFRGSRPPQRRGHRHAVLNRNDALLGRTKHLPALSPGCRYKYIIYWTLSLKQLNHIKWIIPWIWSRTLCRAQRWQVACTKDEPPNQSRMSPATKQRSAEFTVPEQPGYVFCVSAAAPMFP